MLCTCAHSGSNGFLISARKSSSEILSLRVCSPLSDTCKPLHAVQPTRFPYLLLLQTPTPTQDRYELFPFVSLSPSPLLRLSFSLTCYDSPIKSICSHGLESVVLLRQSKQDRAVDLGLKVLCLRSHVATRSQMNLVKHTLVYPLPFVIRIIDGPLS